MYVCPQGQELTKAASYTGNAYRYRADAKVCYACPVKSACTISPRGRTIRRTFDQEYVERVRAYHDTDPCRRAISRRKAWVEPLFAEAKTLHGFSRFHLRGIEKVNIEDLMMAAGQNIKRILKYSGMPAITDAIAVIASVLLALRQPFFPFANPVASTSSEFAT